jgi:hypothetical protein
MFLIKIEGNSQNDIEQELKAFNYYEPSKILDRQKKLVIDHK